MSKQNWGGLEYSGQWQPMITLGTPDEWDRVYATDGDNVAEITYVMDDETGDGEWADEHGMPLDWEPQFWTLLPPLPRKVDVDPRLASGDYGRCPLCGGPMLWEELMYYDACSECEPAPDYDEEADDE